MEVGIVNQRAVLVVVDSIAALARAGDPPPEGSGGGGWGSGGRGTLVDRQEALGQVGE